MELYIVSLVHAESFYKRISASIFFLFICIFMHAQKTVKGKQIFYVQNYTEALAKKYFDTEENLEPIEGIWIANGMKLSIEKDYDGVTRNPNKYRAVRIDVPKEGTAAEDGDIYCFLQKGSTTGIYECTYYLFQAYWHGRERNYKISPFSGVSVQDSPVSFSFQKPCLDGDYGNITGYETVSYLKLYPPVKPVDAIQKETRTSGTGFFISKDGYIITNYHVIENARTIKVSGINDDTKTSYTARVEISDKQNDLAILRITDVSFKPLTNIPYTFKYTTSSVGEDCFVLGYPLISTMGLDIKLTNGIISSKTGFEGNIAEYQMSAPIQPGNSGGPLFDKNGYIIGVVCAKHREAENAGYAIKASYIRNLVDLLPTSITMPQTNLLTGKALPKQVELASKAVCIIIVNGDK